VIEANFRWLAMEEQGGAEFVFHQVADAHDLGVL